MVISLSGKLGESSGLRKGMNTPALKPIFKINKLSERFFYPLDVDDLQSNSLNDTIERHSHFGVWTEPHEESQRILQIVRFDYDPL